MKFSKMKFLKALLNLFYVIFKTLFSLVAVLFAALAWAEPDNDDPIHKAGGHAAEPHKYDRNDVRY